MVTAGRSFFFFDRGQAYLIGWIVYREWYEHKKKGGRGASLAAKHQKFGFVGAYFAAESKNSYKCQIFYL